MKQQMKFVPKSLTLLACLCLGCRPSEESAEVKKLEGTWVQVHALAKEKSKGRGGYYAWVFKGETVVREHTQTLDGEPVTGSSNSGTYKLEVATRPRTIDIVLKSPQGEDWKYYGIFELEGDTLRLCLDKNKRPTAFENNEGSTMYILQRPPKE